MPERVALAPLLAAAQNDIGFSGRVGVLRINQVRLSPERKALQRRVLAK